MPRSQTPLVSYLDLASVGLPPADGGRQLVLYGRRRLAKLHTSTSCPQYLATSARRLAFSVQADVTDIRPDVHLCHLCAAAYTDTLTTPGFLGSRERLAYLQLMRTWLPDLGVIRTELTRLTTTLTPTTADEEATRAALLTLQRCCALDQSTASSETLRWIASVRADANRVLHAHRQAWNADGGVFLARRCVVEPQLDEKPARWPAMGRQRPPRTLVQHLHDDATSRAQTVWRTAVKQGFSLDAAHLQATQACAKTLQNLTPGYTESLPCILASTPGESLNVYSQRLLNDHARTLLEPTVRRWEDELETALADDADTVVVYPHNSPLPGRSLTLLLHPRVAGSPAYDVLLVEAAAARAYHVPEAAQAPRSLTKQLTDAEWVTTLTLFESGLTLTQALHTAVGVHA